MAVPAARPTVSESATEGISGFRPGEFDPSLAPPAVIAAGGVFLPASVCFPLWRVLRSWLDRHRADGGQALPEFAAALDSLRAAGLAHLANVRADGHPAGHVADIGASSSRELLTTEQLAVRLGVSERHARRLAKQAGITAAARNAWHPDDVAHLAEMRKSHAAAPRSASAPERGP